MLTIKTKLDKSHISGIGLFANQNIPKGSIVWSMSELSVIRIAKDKYHNLPVIDKNFIQEKDYYWIDDNGDYMIPIDDSRFINHSENPNIIDKDEYACISSRDILCGEELTINYKTLVPEQAWEEYFKEMRTS